MSIIQKAFDSIKVAIAPKLTLSSSFKIYWSIVPFTLVATAYFN